MQLASTHPPPAGFGAHDHAGCVAAGLAAAEARCREAGLRLTPARRVALELLLREHRALGAYELLEGLAARGLGGQPPAAYRALDFLAAHGFVHRIERLNAYVACARPGQPHEPAFLVCRACRAVVEAPLAAARAEVASAAAAAGFRVDSLVLEAVGLCPGCAATAPEAAA